MSEPTTPSPEPQSEQRVAQPGPQNSQLASQAYQSPQSMQPPHQGFQAPPRPFGGTGEEQGAGDPGGLGL